MTINEEQAKESIEWLISNAFTLEPLEGDNDEFRQFTTKDEGIYGYHTLGLCLEVNTDMPDNYGSVSLLIMDECDEARLVTIADHKGSVAMGLYRLVPKSQLAYSLLHFVYELYEREDGLLGCLKRLYEINPKQPMPWDVLDVLTA